MMEWFNILKSRVRALFRRESVLWDIEEELRVHVEMETETNIKRGMSPDEARAAALKSFGNLARNTERGYDIRGGGWLETLWQDLRYGVRMLLKAPGFTAVAALTLALGIGVNTAIFTLFDIFLRPLPVKDPDTVVTLDRGAYRWFSYPDYAYFRDNAKVFSGLVARGPEQILLNGRDASEETRRVNAEFVSDNFFSTLGVGAILGRTFTPEENSAAGKQPVVVLSHHFWRSPFAADPNAVGHTLRFHGR